MSSDLSVRWRAELIKELHVGEESVRKVLDRIAKLETVLTEYIRVAVLRDISTFFPTATPVTTDLGVFRVDGNEFVLDSIDRPGHSRSILCVVVLDKSQLKRAKILEEFRGFPLMSGIDRCQIRCPFEILYDRDLLRELIKTVFVTGYQWGIEAIAELIGRQLADIGKDFYRIMNEQLSRFPKQIRDTIIITAYYNEVEFPLLSKRFIDDHARSMFSSKLIVPGNNLPAFARYMLACVRNELSPFREAVSTSEPVICNLVDDQSKYYIGRRV